MSSVTAESVLHSRRSLYVGGLSESVNETVLRAAMVPFGPIKSVDIVSDTKFCCIQRSFSSSAVSKRVSNFLYNSKADEFCYRSA